MAWFSRKTSAAQQLSDQLIELFAEAGFTTRFERGIGEEPDRLRGTESGIVISLQRIIPQTLGMEPSSRDANLRDFVRMIANASAGSAPSLDALRMAIRTRIMPRHYGGVAMPRLARAFAGELVTTLVLEPQPGASRGVSDEMARTSGASIDDLFAWGQANVDDIEPTLYRELDNGVRVIGSISHSTSAKVANMAEFASKYLTAAPNGVVFALPLPHDILAKPVGDDLTEVVNEVTTSLRYALALEPVNAQPGGVLSTDVFLWRDNHFSVVGGIDASELGFGAPSEPDIRIAADPLEDVS